RPSSASPARWWRSYRLLVARGLGGVAGQGEEGLIEAWLPQCEAGHFDPLARQQGKAASRGLRRGGAFEPGGQGRRVRLLDDGNPEKAAKFQPGASGVGLVRQPDPQDARAHRGLEFSRG